MNEDRFRELMRRQGLDVLVASSPENVVYFSGFKSFNQQLLRGYQTYAVCPLEKGLEPAIIAGTSEADNVSRSPTKIKDIRFYGSFYVEYRGGEISEPEKKMYKHVMKNPYQSAIEALTTVIKERGLEKATIGLDESNIRVQTYESIKQALPQATIVPSYGLTTSIRAVKTSQEVELLREGAHVTEKSIIESLKEAKTGSTVEDVAGVVRSTLLKEGAQPMAVVVGSGPGAAFPNTPDMTHRLRSGDILRYDVVCVFKNYYSDLGRTAIMGSPKADFKKAYDALLSGLEKGIEFMKPGVSASQVFETIMSTAKAAGLSHYRRHHVGHGIGLELYEVPLICPSDQTNIEDGMVLNLETPYYEFGFGGILIEEAIRVTRSGPDMLSKSPRSLIVV